MSAITGDSLRALVDSIAAQGSLIETHIGAVATADTVLYGMQENCDRISEYADASAEDAKADLYNAFVGAKSSMPDYILDIDHAAIQSLDHHLRRLDGVGMSDYWEAEQYPTHRIPSKFAQIARRIGLYLKAYLVFPPITIMGVFTASDSSVGDFVDGDPIDGNLYGAADLELEVIGGEPITLTATIIGKDENGAVVTGTATFTGAGLGDKVDVTPDQAGKKFLDVTNITITGGTADDAFKVQSKIDRAVSF